MSGELAEEIAPAITLPSVPHGYLSVWHAKPSNLGLSFLAIYLCFFFYQRDVYLIIVERDLCFASMKAPKGNIFSFSYRYFGSEIVVI